MLLISCTLCMVIYIQYAVNLCTVCLIPLLLSRSIFASYTNCIYPCIQTLSLFILSLFTIILNQLCIHSHPYFEDCSSSFFTCRSLSILSFTSGFSSIGAILSLTRTFIKLLGFQFPFSSKFSGFGGDFLMSW